MTPSEVYELELDEYLAFVEHMNADARNQRRRRRR
jgi:hypothetical protein